jgi:hypothetical protein
MKTIGCTILLMLGSASWAEAGIVQITSPSQLSAYDTVNWATFGSVPSTVSTYAQEPSGPLIVHINTASGELALEPGSDVGGFLPTDTLLSQLSGDLSDPILVGFSTPVEGVGTQIESLLSGPFTGQMDLYDSNNNLLGEVSVDASTTTAQDGSAPFIGAISTTSDIDYVIFSVNNGNPLFPKAGDVAINSLDFSVPEPFTLSLFGAGLVGAAILRRRKKAKASVV